MICGDNLVNRTNSTGGPDDVTTNPYDVTTSDHNAFTLDDDVTTVSWDSDRYLEYANRSRNLRSPAEEYFR